MTSRLARVVSAASLLALGSGCASISMAQTARAVPEGALRVGVTTTMVIEAPPGTSSSTSVIVPVPEVSLRYGIGGGADAGIKSGPLGTTLDFKKELVSTPTFVISLDPGLGILYESNIISGAGSSSSSTFFGFQAPLLIGLELPQGNELIFGPKLSGLVLRSSSASFSSSSNVIALGGGVGFAFKVRETLRVMPELNFATKIAGDNAQGGVLFQFGLGFLFNG